MTGGSAAGSHARGVHRADLLLAASRHPLAAVFADGLARGGEFASGRLALLVSGGGDSMALMVLAAAVRRRSDPALESLAVLTVDHGLRPEAQAECTSALALAADLGIARSACVRVKVAPHGNQLDAARTARYEAAGAFVAEHECAAAVVAHTADDRAESLLLGLGRGHGLWALTALLPVRTFADSSTPPILRPLLAARRAALRAFLSDLGVGWHDDPSNAAHERGALRGEPAVARVLDAIADGASRAFDEASELIEFRDRELAARVGRGATSIARAEIERLPHTLQQAAIRAAVRAAGGEISQRSLDGAVAVLRNDDRAPKRFACGGGVELRIDAREVAADTSDPLNPSEGSRRRTDPPRR